MYELQLEIVTNHETQFLALIEIFRHHMRMKKARKKKNDIQFDICCWRKTSKKKRKKNDNKNTENEIKFFVFFTNESNYYLRFSWILNHDFDTHVVNKTMKQRFRKKRDCTDEFMMMSKMKSFFILAYDRMRINVNTFTKKKSMKLLNVNYVFDFMINQSLQTTFLKVKKCTSIRNIVIYIEKKHKLLLFSCRE